MNNQFKVLSNLKINGDTYSVGDILTAELNTVRHLVEDKVIALIDEAEAKAEVAKEVIKEDEAKTPDAINPEAPAVVSPTTPEAPVAPTQEPVKTETPVVNTPDASGDNL